MNSENSLMVQSANSLEGTLNTLPTMLMAQAERDVETYVTEHSDVYLTAAERRSAVVGRALFLTNLVDYVSAETRYHLLCAARNENLAAAHPDHYETLEEWAAAHGTNPSSVSKLMTLFGQLFPVLQNEMRRPDGSAYDPRDIWLRIGVSKLGELASFLSVVLALPESQGGPVLGVSEQRRLDRVERATAAEELNLDLAYEAARPDTWPEVEARIETRRREWTPREHRERPIEFMLRHAEGETFTDLRRTIHGLPNEDEVLVEVIQMQDGTQYVLMPANDTLIDTLQRKLKQAQIRRHTIADEGIWDDLNFLTMLKSAIEGL